MCKIICGNRKSSGKPNRNTGKKETQEQLYMENMAAILAASLEDGMPCPVCGSIHHEKPQTLRQKEDIQALQKQKEALEEEIQAIYETLAGLRTQLQQEQQITFENLPISPKLTEELQKLQTEAAKKELKSMGCKNVTQRENRNGKQKIKKFFKKKRAGNTKANSNG